MMETFDGTTTDCIVLGRLSVGLTLDQVLIELAGCERVDQELLRSTVARMRRAGATERAAEKGTEVRACLR